MLHKQHTQATPITIQVGDSVMKRAPDESCKHTPKFSDAFIVTNRCYPNAGYNMERQETSIMDQGTDEGWRYSYDN